MMKYFLLFFLLFLSACQQQEQGLFDNKNTPIQLSTEASNISVSNQVKNLLQNMDEVKDVQVVISGNEILAAVDIKQRFRFQLEDIQGKLKRKLKSEFPSFTPLVSTDLKIFLESKQINERISNKSISDELLYHEFERIKVLMNEQT